MILYLLFFKQKTAYEMRISDWSSDVCSSDLLATLEVSSALNRNLCASIVTCSNWPGVGSLPLLVSACDMALILSAPALRFSNVDSSTRMPSDGCAGAATASAPPVLLPPRP